MKGKREFVNEWLGHDVRGYSDCSKLTEDEIIVMHGDYVKWMNRLGRKPPSFKWFRADLRGFYGYRW